jgi:replication initiation protein RepC
LFWLLHAKDAEMTQTDAAPTGRRKTTFAMLTARAARPSCYEPTKPGIVLSAFKRAADVLGCSTKGMQLVDTLIGFTRPSDWARGGRIGCWPSNALLVEILCIGLSRLKELFRELQELGLVEIHDSPTGKRYGHRDAEGCVTVFYGFDCSPLACRLIEFQRIAVERRDNWKKGGELRAELTATCKAVMSLANLGQEEGVAGDWLSIQTEARRLSALKGQSYDPVMLEPIVVALNGLHQWAVETLTPPIESVDSDPAGPEKRPLITTTNQLSIAKANTNTDDHNQTDVNLTVIDRKVVAITRREAPNKEKGSGKKDRKIEGALRGFVAHPDFVLQIAPALAKWTDHKHTPTWDDLLNASTTVRSELGISQHAWGQACVILGRIEAVVMLASISARHDAGEVASPGGMLRRMIELHLNGKLRLDRTLFGLAEKLRPKVH